MLREICFFVNEKGHARWKQTPKMEGDDYTPNRDLTLSKPAQNKSRFAQFWIAVQV